MTVVLTHLFKLLSFFHLYLCFILVYLNLITTTRNWATVILPSSVFENCYFGRVTVISMIFYPCTEFDQNRTIRCWFPAKTLLWKWRTSAVLKLENFEFWWCCHLYRNLLQHTKLHQNIKIGQFFIDIWHFDDYKMPAIRHIEFSKFAVWHPCSLLLSCHLLTDQTYSF